jgi:hypothetical protein
MSTQGADCSLPGPLPELTSPPTTISKTVPGGITLEGAYPKTLTTSIQLRHPALPQPDALQQLLE